MNSKDYWVKRTLQVKQSQIDKDEQLSKKLAAEYETLKKSIDDELAKFYGRYAANEGITMAKAKKLLTKAELENFRMSLEAFKEKALEGGYDKELNEIYLRSRISRLQALQTQMDMLIQGLYQDQQEVLLEHLASCYLDTYYQTVYQIQDMSGAFTSSFAHIDTAALDKALTTPWLESDFSSRVWNNRNKLIEELHTVLGQAFVRGDALDKVSRLLAKRMDVSKSRADALVQTEAGHIAEQATLDGYHECGTEEYRYLATLDIKTCPICGPLDDRVFPVREAQPGINYPLMHTRCRCTTVPEVPYQSDTRMARDSVTGKSRRVENMSYRQWRKKYVEDVPEAAANAKKVTAAVEKGAENGIIKLKFASDELMTKHYTKHQAEFDGISIEEYIARANELANAKVSDDVEHLTRSDESTAIYRRSTNEFLVITKDKTIRTFFKPDEKEAYWEYEHERNKE